MKLTTLALAAALLVPSIAAANPDRPDRAERRAERRAQMIERFDTNGDGQLDRQEKHQAKAAIRAHRMERRARRFQRLIQRFDRNHDGSLGPGEVPPKAMQKLRKLDRDGDGWVRPNEMRAPMRRDRDRPLQPELGRGEDGLE